jgi:hypothetical protein
MTTKTKTKSYSNGHHPADPTAERHAISANGV